MEGGGEMAGGKERSRSKEKKISASLEYLQVPLFFPIDLSLYLPLLNKMPEKTH